MSWINYLQQRAQGMGYNPVDLLTAMKYESGLKPDIWGGKNNNYFGLIQFGPNERQKYGVVPGQTTAEGQVDAALNFLRDRGFKPGMGIQDLYSTINAGSPGHYNASDRPGATVASHVQNMLKFRPQMAGLLGQGGPTQPGAPMSMPAQPQAATQVPPQPEIGGGSSGAPPGEVSPSTATATAAPGDVPPTAVGAPNKPGQLNPMQAMALMHLLSGQQREQQDTSQQQWLANLHQRHLAAAGLLGRGA